MNDRTARGLSWATTVVCCVYVAWITHVFATRIPAMAPLFAGLGGKVPADTRFFIGAASGVAPYLVGAALVVLLVVKERLFASRYVRVVISVLVFMAVDMFSSFAWDAMFRPLYLVLRNIG